jgi:phenylacetic acid degradation operon negative regulatory protein
MSPWCAHRRVGADADVREISSVSVAPRSAKEPASAVYRRHAVGAESARGPLFTILGEFVLPSREAVWTSAFIEVLGRLGIEERACRQALTRTAADGWLVSRRVGRQTSWRLTRRAEQLLVEGTERIYGFMTPARDWDGRWLLVLARVPETDRSARHLLRTRLSWAGLGSPGPGVWIGTHTDRRASVEDVLRNAGVFDDTQIFVAEHRGGAEPSAMVRRAWDLDAIDEGYKQFIAEFDTQSTEDPLTSVIELVHAWRRFPWIDPGLPPEMLPASWSGAVAQELFVRRHAKSSRPAMTEWRRISGSRG